MHNSTTEMSPSLEVKANPISPKRLTIVSCHSIKRSLEARKTHHNHQSVDTLLTLIVLVCFVVSNQSMRSLLISGGVRISDSIQSKSVNQAESYSSSYSLLGMVVASPAPEPAPASRRSSATHRGPPINGSIFGKRSINAPTARPTKASGDQTGDLVSTSETTTYQDIITDTIERFMALNTDNDSERASLAFCRMIVYECEQMLARRPTSSIETQTPGNTKPSKTSGRLSPSAPSKRY